MGSFVYIILGVAVILLFWVAFTYNSFVKLVNLTKEAWAGIDVQLKRRYDLIPNLVKAVQQYAKHEKGVFKEVTEARAAAMSAKTPASKGQAENMLTEALKTVFAVAENYPSLRASENYQQLQGELTNTEDVISRSRDFYNANVRDLNTKIQTFPDNAVAGVFNFQKQEFYQLSETDEARKSVSV